MTNKKFLFGILAITLVFAMTAVGCDNGSTGDNNPKPIKFISTDTAGNKYTLVITPGTANTTAGSIAANDSYVLTITIGQTEKVSKGTITFVTSSGVLTMQPKSNGQNSGQEFTITVTTDGQMTDISETITVENGDPVIGPGQVTPGEGGGGSSGGTLTINDIPATYNDKYIRFVGMLMSQEQYVIGAKSVSINGQKAAITSVQIKNGKASLPMWTLSGSGGVSKYTGNDTFTEYQSVGIYDTEVLSLDSGESGPHLVKSINFPSVTFSNGSATKSYNDTEGGGGGDTSDFTYTETANAVTITGYTGTASSISIPAQINGKPVTTIGDYAFYQKSSLTGVTIPNGVTSIKWRAFSDCTSLASVTIPNSVTSIGYGVFGQCTSLTEITVDAGNTTYTSQDGVLYNKDKTNLIQYPAGKAGTTFTIPNSVTHIWPNTFISCTSLTSVTIPNSVTIIESNAFLGCWSLTSVTFQGTITWDNGIVGPFPGDLRDKYLAGGIGTYTRPNGDSNTWTKQGSSGGGGEGGTFTLTGIPSQYNGKYAYLNGGQANGVSIAGLQSVNMSTQTLTLCLISNGSVSIPLWNAENLIRYSGNDTFTISVLFYNTQIITGSDFESSMTGGIAFGPTAFSNGSATRSWSQGGEVITP